MFSKQKFQQDIKTGEIGEIEVLKILNSKPNVKGIIDVRNDKKYQVQDVDFLVMTVDGKSIKIEVKTDTQTDYSNNLFYETLSSIKKNTIGCFKKTKADILIYHLKNSGKTYQINVKSIRKFVENNKYRLKEVEGGDNALGFLIDFNELKRLGIAKEINKKHIN